MEVNRNIHVIGFIQDEIDLPLEMKYPIPKDEDIETKEESHFDKFVDYNNLELCYADKEGNIHFSPNFNPEPYIYEGNVILPVGDLCMKYGSIFMQRMGEANEMLDNLEKS